MKNPKTIPVQIHLRKVNQNLLLLGLAVLTVIPVLIVRFLPMQDYPQWLYQAYVISHFRSFANIYSISWISIPNLGSTLPLLALTPLLGAEVAGKILLIINTFLFVLGYAYYVHGVDETHPGLRYLGPLFIFSYFFYYGFFSFILGLTLALFSFGYIIRLPASLTWKHVVALTALSTAAYFCHLLIWAPILIYILISGLFTHQLRKTIISQIVPLLLFFIYIFYRVDRTKLYFSLFVSLNQKLFSLISPILLFQRVDPFPSIIPILILNLAIIGIAIITITIGLWKFLHSKINHAKLHLPLLITVSILFTIAVFFPINMIAGAYGLDQRFLFISVMLGYPLLLSLMNFTISPKFTIPLSLLVILFHAIVFVSAGTELSTIHQALHQIPSNATINVAIFRNVPVYGECDPKIMNFGNGVYPLEWFPDYEAISRRNMSTSIFETAMLHQKAGSRLQLQIGDYSNQPNRDAFIRQLSSGSLQWDYVVIFHCPGVLTLPDNIPWQIYDSGGYFDIFKRQNTP